MLYDLNVITEQGILIDTKISFNESYLKLTQIKELNNCIVKGKIYYSTTKEVIFNGKVKGIMKLNDYYSNNLIDYPFEIDINEILESEEYDEKKHKTGQNSLDLKEILWQNIVLEVPIRATKEKELKIKEGEGWKLIDENSKKEDPRLECFRTLLDEGKE